MNNPLLFPYTTIHQTAPFNLIKNEHYLEAFRLAIEEARAEIQQIIQNQDEASFENVVVALDTSGEQLERIQAIFFNLNSAETSDEMQQLAQQIAPLLSEFSNDITLNADLFLKIKRVYQQKEGLNLTTEQSTLLENTYQHFVRQGANMNEKDKERYRVITNELSRLSLKFNENVLAETNAFELHITEASDISGIPAFDVEAAARLAQSKGKEGWIFTLHHPSYLPFIKYADNRELREKIFRAFSSKANHNDQFDNKEIIRQILQLKQEKARLLGYDTHAEYQLKRRMAETTQRVYHFLDELHQASRPVSMKEFAAVQEFAEKSGFSGKIQRWDWAYYSTKLKNQRYGFDEEDVKPYLQLGKVIEGVFGLAEQLYGLSFKENTDIEVYHPDVKAYEVFCGGTFLAVLYADFFPREGKQSGAWMTDYRRQSNIYGEQVRPHVSIVMNFTKPFGNTPSLLTFDELTTFLHEFGHALHGMLTQCTYPSVSGTSVYRDFVELPSQIHENWAYQKTWLDRFAVHYKTGEKMPEELIHKIIDAKNFQAAYQMERQLSFALLDMAYYSQSAIDEDIAGFEQQSMSSTNLFDPVAGSLQSTSFSHIFGGGYDAGYYSYKWAEVLDADAFSVFEKNGIFDQQTADSFRENILEKGGSDHPMNLYKAFRGKEPEVTALLKRDGLI